MNEKPYHIPVPEVFLLPDDVGLEHARIAQRMLSEIHPVILVPHESTIKDELPPLSCFQQSFITRMTQEILKKRGLTYKK